METPILELLLTWKPKTANRSLMAGRRARRNSSGTEKPPPPLGHVVPAGGISFHHRSTLMIFDNIGLEYSNGFFNDSEYVYEQPTKLLVIQI